MTTQEHCAVQSVRTITIQRNKARAMLFRIRDMVLASPNGKIVIPRAMREEIESLCTQLCHPK